MTTANWDIDSASQILHIKLLPSSCHSSSTNPITPSIHLKTVAVTNISRSKNVHHCHLKRELTPSCFTFEDIISQVSARNSTLHTVIIIVIIIIIIRGRWQLFVSNIDITTPFWYRHLLLSLLLLLKKGARHLGRDDPCDITHYRQHCGPPIQKMTAPDVA